MPTLGVVVLDGDDAAAGRLGALEQRGAVDGLDGERVDDAHVDAGLGQRVGRLHGVHQRDASAYQRHLVARALPHHLSTQILKRCATCLRSTVVTTVNTVNTHNSRQS